MLIHSIIHVDLEELQTCKSYMWKPEISEMQLSRLWAGVMKTSLYSTLVQLHRILQHQPNATPSRSAELSSTACPQNHFHQDMPNLSSMAFGFQASHSTLAETAN